MQARVTYSILHAKHAKSCRQIFKPELRHPRRSLYSSLLRASGFAMYSGSSSYLSGGNSARPGQPQYGQQSLSIPQGQQPQINSITSQPTGFGNVPTQQQYTSHLPQTQSQSFQSQPMQPQQQQQFTGFPSQNQQSLQQQPFQTGQVPQAHLPHKTGQTSAQIAQSFQGSAPPTPAAQPVAASNKIPKIRLSFLTAQDQAKFEQLFKSAVGDEQALDGANPDAVEGNCGGFLYWLTSNR